ncbi:MAG: amidohydrolase family protein, partial [Sandaracinaceae bacterium]|nr:amidohydrolase family protein [Sandaracinaceae bacterium]
IVHTHAAEHPGERVEVRAAYGVDDVVALERMGISGERAVLAHGVQLTKALMARLAKLGTRVVHCPSANLKLASGIADVVSMRRAGVLVGIGADGAPCNNRLDPWTELRQAALLAKVKQKDAAALAAADALAMMTIDGARVLGLSDRAGSIEVGKRADVIVVDLEGAHALPGGDPVTRLVYSCTAADVREVFVDGRWIVRHREVTSLDEARVRADAKSEAKKILRRAKL